MDVKLVKAETSEAETSGTSRQYDTRFVAPLNFLDHAQNLICRDITHATLGQFVLIQGKVSIRDLPVLRKAWDLDSVQRLVFSGANQTNSVSRQQRRQAERTQAHSKPIPTETELAFDMLKVIPHGIQGNLDAKSFGAWFSLREDCFVTQPNDLSLNHGKTLAGEWVIVGILDAMPDGEEEDDGTTSPSNPIIAGLTGYESILGAISGTLQPAMRTLLGRPRQAFGVTPILIFREIRG